MPLHQVHRMIHFSNCVYPKNLTSSFRTTAWVTERLITGTQCSAGNPRAPKRPGPLTPVGHTGYGTQPTPNSIPGLAQPLSQNSRYTPPHPLPCAKLEASAALKPPHQAGRQAQGRGNVALSNVGISRLLQHPYLACPSHNRPRCLS